MKSKIITEDVIMRSADRWKLAIRLCALFVLSAAVAKCSGQTVEFTAPFSMCKDVQNQKVIAYSTPIHVQVTDNFVYLDGDKSLCFAIQGNEDGAGRPMLILDTGVLYVQENEEGHVVTWVTSVLTWAFYSFTPLAAEAEY